MSSSDINQSLSKVGAGLHLGVGYGTNGGMAWSLKLDAILYVLASKCCIVLGAF